jgi:hypothetical protein
LPAKFARRGSHIPEGSVRQNISTAMRAAGIRPVMIYAYVHTGLLVTEHTYRLSLPPALGGEDLGHDSRVSSFAEATARTF